MNGIYVFLGGGAGSLLRYFIGMGIQRFQLQLPFATLISNSLACLIFALTLYSFSDRLATIPPLAKNLILIGVCGGLSTFSTFSYETFQLLQQKAYAWATLNILLSTVLCITLFYCFQKSVS
jgi:fluoride exporter